MSSYQRPKFYRSESEMSPGPPGGISPPVLVPGSAPPIHSGHHHFQNHYHQTPPGKLRDRSPRLSAEMRKNRDATSTSSGGSSTMMQHRGSITQCSGIGSIGLPILGGRGRGVMSDSHMQRTFNEAMRQRRTSLPANSLSLNGTKSLITGSSLSEAKGLIADMLMNKELPGNVATCLRAVATLLEQRPLPINGLLSEYGLPSVIENPYGGESMVIGDFKVDFRI
ncbi:hypothetical protein L3Y34_018982 [Caenorhabditis briggsae]|uniref:Uncharacterized protein n=1 Tax=Caenorhabditis briggsae TaxID=6238 RepID=A0AAE9DM67_CAEBR|nr:hypothetical protein L3Y34_018982 [Caenorhabditis briggsae]